MNKKIMLDLDEYNELEVKANISKSIKSYADNLLKEGKPVRFEVNLNIVDNPMCISTLMDFDFTPSSYDYELADLPEMVTTESLAKAIHDLNEKNAEACGAIIKANNRYNDIESLKEKISKSWYSDVNHIFIATFGGFLFGLAFG